MIYNVCKIRVVGDLRYVLTAVDNGLKTRIVFPAAISDIVYKHNYGRSL